MTDSRAEAGKVKDVPRNILGQKARRCSKNEEDVSKGHKSLPESVLTDNLSIKIHNDSKRQ